MRRVYLAVALLVLTAACGRPAPDESGTAVVAGASVEPAPEPTTTVPTTTTVPAPAPAPAPTVSPPATERRPGPPPPATTVTTVPRPTTTSTTIHPPTATVSALGATVTLTAKPRDLIPGFRFSVDVTTAPLQHIERITYDFGDGQITEIRPPEPGLCSRQPRVVSDWAHKTWLAPGSYRVRVTVTIVPCWPAVGPPGSPDGAPLPDAPRHPVVASLVVTQDQGMNEPLRRP